MKQQTQKAKKINSPNWQRGQVVNRTPELTFRDAAEALTLRRNFSPKIRSSVRQLNDILGKGLITAYFYFGPGRIKVSIPIYHWNTIGIDEIYTALRSKTKKSYRGNYRLPVPSAINMYIKQQNEGGVNASLTINSVMEYNNATNQNNLVYIDYQALEDYLNSIGSDYRIKNNIENRGARELKGWPDVMVEVAILMLGETIGQNQLKSKAAEYYAEKAIEICRDRNPHGDYPSIATLRKQIYKIISAL